MMMILNFGMNVLAFTQSRVLSTMFTEKNE